MKAFVAKTRMSSTGSGKPQGITMNEKIAALQNWLNAKGCFPSLIVDGLPGPNTRKAIFNVFRNRMAAAITADDIVTLAKRYNVTTKQIRAVAMVESANRGWDNDGLLACLYERHYGWKRFKLLNPLLSNPKPGGYTVDVDHDGINDSWEKVADSALLFKEPNKAFECASWGSFQIMGAWAEKLGYGYACEFVWQLSRSELAHYEAFFRYLETFKLIGALRKVDGNPINCTELAVGYNGPKQKGYDSRIAAAFRKLP
jgi:hypothetical protein